MCILELIGVVLYEGLVPHCSFAGLLEMWDLFRIADKAAESEILRQKMT